jgi:hypothetical protein
VRRRLAVLATAACVALAVGAAGAGAATGSVSIESLTPPSGAVGTDVAYALAGTDAAGAVQCANSSAYRLELLAPSGALVTTGGGTVLVPDGTPAGKATIRLVCYVPDATNRRVIYGLCARFDITDAATPAESTGKAKTRCPATARVVLGQSVIAVERAMSEAFNPKLYYPLPK